MDKNIFRIKKFIALFLAAGLALTGCSQAALQKAGTGKENSQVNNTSAQGQKTLKYILLM